MKVNKSDAAGWFKKAGRFAGDLKQNINQNYQQYRQQKLNDRILTAELNLRKFALDSKQQLVDFSKQHRLDLNQTYDAMIRIDQLSTQTALTVDFDHQFNAEGDGQDRLDQTRDQRVLSQLRDLRAALLAGLSNFKLQYRSASRAQGLSDAQIATKLTSIDDEINDQLTM